MKFTNEDLMKAIGLKVGDRIKANIGTITTIFEVRNDFRLLRLERSDMPITSFMTNYALFNLLDMDYEVLPATKHVGDFECTRYIPDCFRCPIRSTCSGSVGKLNSKSTLYQHLEAYKDSKISFDQEIYDILKARLDKEVEE